MTVNNHYISVFLKNSSSNNIFGKKFYYIFHSLTLTKHFSTCKFIKMVISRTSQNRAKCKKTTFKVNKAPKKGSRPGPVTNNGLRLRDLIRTGARSWKRLPKPKKDKYRRTASTVSKKKSPVCKECKEDLKFAFDFITEANRILKKTEKLLCEIDSFVKTDSFWNVSSQ